MSDLGQRLAKAAISKEEADAVRQREDQRRRLEEKEYRVWNAYAIFDLLTPHVDAFNAATSSEKRLIPTIDDEIISFEHQGKHVLTLEVEWTSVWIIRPSGVWAAKDIWALDNLAEGNETFSNLDFAEMPVMNGEQFSELILSIALLLRR